MAIQLRRGYFSDFDASKLVPGELAVVLGGDPDAENGQSLYICFAPGVVKRIGTAEEVKNVIDYFDSLKDEISKDVTEAIEEKVKHVIDTIPEDYSSLSDTVDRINAIVKTRTKNVFSPVWEKGFIVPNTGEFAADTSSISDRVFEKIDVDPNTVYRIYEGTTNCYVFATFAYDANNNYLGVNYKNSSWSKPTSISDTNYHWNEFTTPDNAAYVILEVEPTAPVTYSNVMVCKKSDFDKDSIFSPHYDYAPLATQDDVNAIKEDYSQLSESITEISDDINDLTKSTFVISDNRFDGVFDESGYINPSTGIDAPSNNFKRTSKYLPLDMSGSTYVNVHCSEIVDTLQIVIYDESKGYVGKINCDNKLIVSGQFANAFYFRVYTRSAYNGNVYVSPINKSEGNYDYYRTEVKYIKEERVESLSKYAKKTDVSPKKLKGKVIVNFGDSMFGNFRDATSISSQLAEITGATVYNCGFGGCQMANRGTGQTAVAWSAFSMYALADAICSGDFSYQEANKNYGTTSGNTIPSYFASETLPRLESIDFSAVDIITIAYGTNDYTAGQEIDDTATGFDVTTYIGAFKYSIKKIQQTYPKIKILVITPIWRYWSETEDSDVKDYGHGTLKEIKDKLVNASKSMRIPCLDSYENLSLSLYNALYYFETNDKTHINSRGRKAYAELIDGALEKLF